MDEEPPAWSAMLEDIDGDVARLVRTLREAALRALPDLTERYYPGWRGLGLRHPRAGLVATLFTRETDVAVYLERGASLPDPEGLFEGAERLKQTRVITFRPDSPTPTADQFVAYLDLAIEHAAA